MTDKHESKRASLLENAEEYKYGSISKKKNTTKDIKNDDNKLVYVLFFIQGVGMLLPWNFFTTANSYFRSKFHADVPVEDKFENAFSVGSQLPCAFGLFVNLYMTGRVSRSVRVAASLIVMTACFTVTTIFVNVNTDTWTDRFFVLTMCCLVIINFCSGIYQGTIFGIAGITGARYIQAAVTGMGLGAVFAAIANFISLSTAHDITNSAFSYFTTATTVTFMCLVTYFFLFRLNFMKQVLQTPPNENFANHRTADEMGTLHKVWFTFKGIYRLAFSVLFLFFVTLALMPSVISKIKSTKAWDGSAWNSTYFSTLVCFLVFSSGDMLGRVAAGNIQIVAGSGYRLPALCILRVVFIPLFALCNYQPRHYLPVVFNHDFVPVVLNTVFAFSNGYLTSLCMMYAPSQVPKLYMETASVIMQLFITLGLCLGSVFSFVVVALI